MSRARRVLVVVVVLAAVGLVAVSLSRGAKGGLTVGQPAPLFVSTDLSGQPVMLSAFRGRPVILNFWASWCVPCRTEFPVLQQLLARHPGVVVLGVVFEDTDSSARAFLHGQGATWPGVRDPKAQIADAYDVHAKPGIPVSVVIDASGRVRGFNFGPLSNEASADAFVAQAGASATPSGT